MKTTKKLKTESTRLNFSDRLWAESWTHVKTAQDVENIVDMMHAAEMISSYAIQSNDQVIERIDKHDGQIKELKKEIYELRNMPDKI